MSKTGWIIAGIVGVLVVLFLVSKNNSAQPTIGSGAIPTASTGGTLSSLLGAGGTGALSGLTDAFSNGDTGSNDAGLEDDDYGD